MLFKVSRIIQIVKKYLLNKSVTKQVDIQKIQATFPSLYFGNLLKHEPQYQLHNFWGLALYPVHEREIKHNATDKLPFSNLSVSKIQSQDVFEHLPYESIPGILNEIYRVLKVGGKFRLSVPDYRSPLLKRRSVFNGQGEAIADLMMGASVRFDKLTNAVTVQFSTDGNAHLWFPTYDLILAVIQKSEIRNCTKITFYQYFSDNHNYVVDNIPYDDMPVERSVPNDMRADGKPISIVLDFVK